MNTIFDSLPQKEASKFKQVVQSYDKKNYKKGLKILVQLQKKNPKKSGNLKRVQINAMSSKIFPRTRQ